MTSRACATCQLTSTKSSFSDYQWGRGKGLSKCNACIRSATRAATLNKSTKGTSSASANQTTRRTHSSKAPSSTNASQAARRPNSSNAISSTSASQTALRPNSSTANSSTSTSQTAGRTNSTNAISFTSASQAARRPNSNNAISSTNASQTARKNNANRATFASHALDRPFAEGTFRWVAKGVYTNGPRCGEPCVCKWFKSGHVMEAHFYDTDVKMSNEAIRLISQWNENKHIDRMVQVNLPAVWTFLESSGKWAGRKYLQEPFIEKYQKFNSNSGWADDSFPWARVMQALSHFSYHTSGGTTLLCDLQGGVYKDGVVLTDPVIMSNMREYGPTDLGSQSQGISSFFSSHVCNEYCNSQWRRPQNQTRYYTRTARTSTEHHVPTSTSRPKMTMKSNHK